jgi:NodT family efflux transporter outer membrane factor (OMF) lipoprotein
MREKAILARGERTLHPAAWLGILLSLLAVGCTVGPNYRRPETPVAQTWAEASDGLAAEPVTLAQWWTLFRDDQLDSLVDRAVQSNKDLQLAEARIRQARAQRRVTASSGLPTLNATGSYSRIKRSSAFSSTFGAGTTGGTAGFFGGAGSGALDLFQTGLDATWEIDVFGGVRRSVEAANASIAASQENLNDALVTLLGEVATNYFQLRGNQRRIEIARQNIETQRQTVELAQGKFKAGLGSRLEVVQAEALLATTESQIPALDAAAKQSIHQLGVLLGSEPGALLQELSPPKPMPPAPPDVPIGLPSDLLRRRPDIRRAERQLAAATAQIGVAAADLFPRLSLTGSAGYQSTKSSRLFEPGSQFWSYGPGLTLPLFSGGRIRGNIQVQTALQEQALITYESAVLTALQDVENAIVVYADTQAAHDALARAVDANRQAAQISHDLYQKGLTDFLNVLQSEGALYQVEDQLMQNEQQTLTALVALFKALGGGWQIPPEGAWEY